MTTGVKLTAGLVGLFVAACLDALIHFGTAHYHSGAVAASMALTAFGLMLVVAAFESRSVTQSALTHASLDNAKMNWTAAGELVLAVAITQTTLFNRLLDTTPLKFGQFGVALASAVVLLVLWELGKAYGRRAQAHGERQSAPAAPVG